MASVNSSERQFDLLIFGATGFTGQLAAEYVTERYGPSSSTPLRFGLAGRSEKRLRQLVTEHLVALDPRASSIPLIEADVSDEMSIRKMAKLCRTVANFVGPYDLFGEVVVSACVESGTHYCDCTGEFSWVKKMQEKYHQLAIQRKVKILHFCGFDCVPSDIGTFLLQETANSRYGVACCEARQRIDGMRAGISGGTAMSLIGILKNTDKKEMDDPYDLCNFQIDDEGRDIAKPKSNRPIIKYENDVGYTTLFPGDVLNRKAVHWSNHLQNYSYGFNFRYDERFAFGWSLWRSLLFSFTMFLITGPILSIVRLFMRIPVCWSFLCQFAFPYLTRRGPPRSQFNTFHFRSRIFGTTAKDAEGNERKVVCRIQIEIDPGYVATSRMVTECALCMAKNLSECPNRFGVLTPSVGLGMKVVERLNDAGIKIWIES